MKNSLLKSLLAVALNFVLISVLHAKTENVIAPSNTRQPQPTTQHYVLRLAHNPAPEDLDGEATDDGYSSDDDDYSSDEEDVFSDEDPEDPKTSTLHLVLRLRGEQPAKTSPLLSEEKMIGEADEVLLSATRAVSLLAQEEAKYSAHPTAARAVQRKEQETQTDDDLFNLVAPRATVINTTPLPNPINGQPLFEDSERDEDAFKASDSALRSLDENSSTDNEEYEDARSAVSAPSPVVPADEAIVIFPEEEITAALALSLEDATNLDQAIVEEPALVLVQEDAPVAIITETRFVLREDEPAPIVVAQPKQSTTRRSPALHTESPKIVQPSALPADIIARAQRLHDELRTSMPSTNEKRPAQLIDEALCGLLQNKLLKGEFQSLQPLPMPLNNNKD